MMLQKSLMYEYRHIWMRINERILMKCACGAETVVKNYVRTIHSVNQ